MLLSINHPFVCHRNSETGLIERQNKKVERHDRETEWKVSKKFNDKVLFTDK